MYTQKTKFNFLITLVQSTNSSIVFQGPHSVVDGRGVHDAFSMTTQTHKPEVFIFLYLPSVNLSYRALSHELSQD